MSQAPPAPFLAPLPEPIAVIPDYVAQQPTTLILAERSFSLGSATIKDVNGQDVFRVVGKSFSMSGRREVTDMTGKSLFTIRRELFSIPSTYYCEAPGGERFLDIRGKWSFGKSKSEVQFVNNIDQQPITIHLQEDFFDAHAEIKLDGGHVICCVDRKMGSFRSMFAGADTYQLTVAPGMDIAACVAMCISMDMRLQERRR